MSLCRALLLLAILCVPAAAGDAWAVRQNGVIEVPAVTAGAGVGITIA